METGWAKLQSANGMITESLSGGCMGATGVLDGGGGRVMGDVSTIYVIQILEMYEFTNDYGLKPKQIETNITIYRCEGGPEKPLREEGRTKLN